MSKRDIGQEILEGLREVKAHKTGEKVLRTRTLKEPAPPQIIRANLKLSQSAFAGLMGVSLRTVQDWEQGRRKPSGPAAALLRIAEQKPEVFTQLSYKYLEKRAKRGGREKFLEILSKVPDVEPQEFDRL